MVSSLEKNEMRTAFLCGLLVLAGFLCCYGAMSYQQIANPACSCVDCSCGTECPCGQ